MWSGEQNYQINKDKEVKRGAGIRVRFCVSATGDWDWSFRGETREENAAVSRQWESLPVSCSWLIAYHQVASLSVPSAWEESQEKI